MKALIQSTLIFTSLQLMVFHMLATTLHVPANYGSIESALNAANSFDTVLVQPGVYHENIVWPLVHGIKLLSAGDTTNTTISGISDIDRVIRFLPNFWYDSTTVINGFTITNGNGGISMEFASPKLVNLHITRNEVSNLWAFGGGIKCIVSSPILENVSITNNTLKNGIWHEGGGMFCEHYSQPKLTNVIIANNKLDTGAIYYFGAGLMFTDGSCPILKNVLVVNNTMDSGGIYYRSGGISLSDSATIMNVTIAGNRRLDGLELEGSGLTGSPNCIVTNSILWNPGQGDEVAGIPTILYSDVRGGWNGDGNINSNPLFIDNDDFHLQSNSPCIEAGTITGAPTFDLEEKPRPIGTNIDMGVYEVGEPADFIADNRVVCEGNVVAFTDLSAGTPISWLWTFEGGIPATSTNQNPSVIYDTAGSFNVELQTSYGINSFSKIKTSYITVDTLLAQPSTPTGNILVCNSNVVHYTTDSVPYASSYEWEVLPVEAGNISGDSLVGVFHADDTWTGSFTIKVRPTNNNCSGNWSNELLAELVINPTPFFITGDGPYCEGSQGSELTMEDSELGVTYELYRDNESTGINTPGTGTAVSFGYVTEEGIYSAVGHASEVCSSNMWGDVWVYMNYLPEQQGEINGPEEVCNNENSQYYSTGSLYADSLIWELFPDEAGQIISNGNDISIVWSNSFTNIAYLSCIGINECGYGWPADLFEIIVKNTPNPEISGSTLVCVNSSAEYETDYTSGTTYSWDVTNGEIIEGSGTHQINILWGDSTTGYIHLLEIDSAGCEQQTDDYIVTIDDCLGLNDQNNSDFSLIPNPTKDWIQIIGNTDIVKISVLNNVGRTIIVRNIPKVNKTRLDLSLLQSGIYTIVIRGENTVSIHRVVKL